MVRCRSRDQRTCDHFSAIFYHLASFVCIIFISFFQKIKSTHFYFNCVMFYLFYALLYLYSYKIYIRFIHNRAWMITTHARSRKSVLYSLKIVWFTVWKKCGKQSGNGRTWREILREEESGPVRKKTWAKDLQGNHCSDGRKKVQTKKRTKKLSRKVFFERLNSCARCLNFQYFLILKFITKTTAANFRFIRCDKFRCIFYILETFLVYTCTLCVFRN